MSMLNLMIKLAKQLPQDTYNPLIVTRGLPHNVTTEMDLELWHTAKTIQVDSRALAEFKKNTTSTLAEAYLARQLHPTSQEAINQFFDKYGMRGVGEIDIGQPRWREEPAHIIQVLQSYLQIDDENKAPDKLFAQGAEKADLEKIAIVEALRKTHGGRLKARLFNFAASRMRALAGLRESPKFFIIRMMGIVRKSLLESGRELVEEGVLSQPDDLFFLDLAELKRLAAGDNEDWKTLVSQRRRVHQREKQRTQIPRLLLSDGHAFYEGMALYDGEASKSAVVDDYHMVGSPVSPGVVEGRAHIIFDPASEMLSPGEILVCPGTDPAWTPLFLAAGGLVMEVGGLMTHGSVVAREYGIPAVVGVHKATTALKTGQLIRVDGTAGIITILNSDGE